jgi:hypothetical protein
MWLGVQNIVACGLEQNDLGYQGFQGVHSSLIRKSCHVNTHPLG